jgi:hypothetical protein
LLAADDKSRQIVHIMAKTNILKALEAARAKVSKLEQAVAAKHNRQLAALPAQHGFSSIEAFLKAVKAAAAGGRRTSAPARHRKRAVITTETKAKLKALAEAGKTGREIAKTLGISLPSVQNIKRELGLTKRRKK